MNGHVEFSTGKFKTSPAKNKRGVALTRIPSSFQEKKINTQGPVTHVGNITQKIPVFIPCTIMLTDELANLKKSPVKNK